ISESDFGHAQADLGYLRNLLPYESLALQVSAGEWAAMSATERNKFVSSLEARLQLFQKIDENSTYWKALREGDDPQDYVAQLPLEQLP
ncbi:MAG TPA: hypothetical protein VGO11_19205, partial [Chthoniobacteraceae bacterium]|nr:hypothetical protein [Chthoniobacteraceae bacterium]